MRFMRRWDLRSMGTVFGWSWSEISIRHCGENLLSSFARFISESVMRSLFCRSAFLITLVPPALFSGLLFAQLENKNTHGTLQAPPPVVFPPVNFTADQDRQNMMDQLGIKALRPGGSANEKAPDRVNYDESKANPFPDLPAALKMKNGK